MSEKELYTYYEEYLEEKLAKGALISVSGFKKYLLSKKVKITTLYSLDAWSGVRGELDVYYEDYLIERASCGERNSQTYTQLLNKFYDTQARRGDNKPPIKIEIDFKNDGVNKLNG